MAGGNILHTSAAGHYHCYLRYYRAGDMQGTKPTKAMTPEEQMKEMDRYLHKHHHLYRTEGILVIVYLIFCILAVALTLLISP